jgi:hypothetical protein
LRRCISMNALPAVHLCIVQQVGYEECVVLG